MSKNIALFVDGTKNHPHPWGSSRNTNVRRLFEAAKAAHQVPDRLAYMHGIGTGRKAEIVPGGKVSYGTREWLNLGMTGLGMAARVRWAYRFLSEAYDRDDRTYLFGFSRGAFAARSIAGFVSAVGLLLRDVVDEKIEEAWRIYETFDERQPNAGIARLRQFLVSLIAPHLSPEPNDEQGTVLRVHLIGVWDTVAALGLPGLGVLTADRTRFHRTDLPRYISNARHALAVHEIRHNFEPLLWPGTHPEAPNQSLKQQWFVGAHSNVGGGVAAGASWADLSLHWMAEEARDLLLPLLGLPFSNDPVPPSDQVDNSRRGLFRWAPCGVREPLRNWTALEPRTLATVDVHPSVLARLRSPSMPGYGFRRRVNCNLQRADDVSLRLAIGVRLRGRLPWLGSVVVGDLLNATSQVQEMFGTATALADGARDRGIRSVLVSAVCDGPDIFTTLERAARTLLDDAGRLSREKKIADEAKLSERFTAVCDRLREIGPLLPANTETRCQEARDRVSSMGFDWRMHVFELKPRRPLVLRSSGRFDRSMLQ